MMEGITEEEKKNRKIGMITAVVLHVVLLLLFFFLVAWRQEIPPPKPIGMSMNFGTSEAGSGRIQPEREQSEQQEVQQPQPEETSEVQTESSPQETADPVETTQPVSSEAVQKTGPVKAETKKAEEVKEEAVKQQQTQSEEVQEEKKEERKVEAAFGPKSDETNTSDNQGTKDNTTGDQGSEEGNIDSRTTFGGAGEGGGGFSHSFTGWGTDFRLPDDKPEATGVLEFRIKIDDRGDVVSITTRKMIGNPEAEKFYRDLIIREMKFYRTQGGDVPPFSEGTITLNLKVK